MRGPEGPEILVDKKFFIWHHTTIFALFYQLGIIRKLQKFHKPIKLQKNPDTDFKQKQEVVDHNYTFNNLDLETSEQKE